MIRKVKYGMIGYNFGIIRNNTEILIPKEWDSKFKTEILIRNDTESSIQNDKVSLKQKVQYGMIRKVPIVRNDTESLIRND